MEQRERILTHCREFLSQWTSLPDDSFQIKNFASTSNLVYLVWTSADVSPQQVIYRVFGAAEIVDITQERELFQWLSELGFGPFSYGSTGTYRVEEYIHGRPLDRLELRDPAMAKRICASLKLLHQQDLSSLVNPNECVTIANAAKWRKMGQNRLPGLSLSAIDHSELSALLSDSLWAQYLSLFPHDSPLVFSHHDCNELNFLYVESENRVRPIDYEYSGYSVRGVDLSLTINELLYSYTHPEPPYWTYHPGDLFDDELLTRYVRCYGGDACLWAETRLCLCVTHYFWALWSVAMHKEGGFDYIKYAELRLNDFRREAATIAAIGGVDGVRRRAQEAMGAD